MRVLIVRPGPSFSVQDVAFGWRDALRGYGCQVADFNFDDRLDFYCSAHLEDDGEWKKAFDFDQGVALAAKGIYAACYEFMPEVIIIISGFFVPPDVLTVLHSRGFHHIVAVCTESPYEDDQQSRFVDVADTILLNDPTNVAKFRERNPNTYYAPHCYDPRRHYPSDCEKEYDFAFVGTGFPSRVEMFEQIDFRGLNAVLGGSWMSVKDDSPLAPLVAHRRDWCMDNEETAEVYRATKTSLNLYRREHSDKAHATGWSMGPREVELAACGTFFLRDSRPESDELLPMLPTFTEAAEVRPLLDWWLAHDAEREKAAMQAHDAVADRTFAANARWLLQHVRKD